MQVDVQSEIEISLNFYWSLWGNQAAAAAAATNLIGFGGGEQKKQTIERSNEKLETVKVMKPPLTSFLLTCSNAAVVPA